jgi:hypothetical protein
MYFGKWIGPDCEVIGPNIEFCLLSATSNVFVLFAGPKPRTSKRTRPHTEPHTEAALPVFGHSHMGKVTSLAFGNSDGMMVPGVLVLLCAQSKICCSDQDL